MNALHLDEPMYMQHVQEAIPLITQAVRRNPKNKFFIALLSAASHLALVLQRRRGSQTRQHAFDRVLDNGSRTHHRTHYSSVAGARTRSSNAPYSSPSSHHKANGYVY